VTARSHPSVILYGLGNECNVENPEAEPFFAELAARARQLDPTRLLSYAALYAAVGPLSRLVDVVGINEYWGWYDKNVNRLGWGSGQAASAERQGEPREPIDLGVFVEKVGALARTVDKPLLLTEFGADSVPGLRSASRELWSEDYHADLLAETFAAVAGFPEIVGTFPFCFADYRDPSKYINDYWDGLNYKGLVSYARRPKRAYYAVRAAYRGEPMTEDRTQ